MENNESKLLGMERCVILQAIAENYLIRTTGKHFEEAYPEVQEEYGVLLEQHIRLLKAYLNEEYAERIYKDATPQGIIELFGLENFDYTLTSKYGHFGFNEFPWENK